MKHVYLCTLYSFMLCLKSVGQDRPLKYDSTRLGITIDSVVVRGDSHTLKCYWQASNNYGIRLKLDFRDMPAAYERLNRQFMLPNTRLNEKWLNDSMARQRARKPGCYVFPSSIYMPPDSTYSFVTDLTELPIVESGHEIPLKIREITYVDLYFDDGRKFHVLVAHKN